MRKTLIGMLAVVAGASIGFAQGVLSVSLTGSGEVPPNSSSSAGTGSLTLSGDYLSYTVTVVLFGGSLPVDAVLAGPATTSQNGPTICDLGTPTVNTAGADAFATYSGTQALTPGQVSDLKNDLDYLNVFTTLYPGGEIRGQVSLVPEPGTASLLAMAGGVAWVARGKRAKR